VFDAGPDAQITDPANWAYMQTISQWLTGPEAPAHIQAVQSPTLNPAAASALIAPDGQVGMVVVTLNTTDLTQQSALLDAIGAHLKDAPAGLSTYRTGETAIGRTYNETIAKSVDRTVFVTLVLVVLILLAIYRSPVSPFIPLFVVTVAFMIARGIVAWLGESVFTVSDTAVMLLIVVMYGAGTDYCLFLISRFREEMADTDDARASIRNTVRHVGESISSSAGTVITGFMAMAFAQLGLFNTTGPTLAVGVIVSLLAGLTLTPAILGLLGQRAFWPGRARHRSAGALYQRTSQLVSSRPLLAILSIVVVMAPIAVYGGQQEVTYDFLADLPDNAEPVEGFRVLEAHIGAGEMQPLTTVAVFKSGDLLTNIENLTQRLASVDGVASVRSASQPFGPEDAQTAGITRLDHQLGALAVLTTPGDGHPTPEQAAIMQALLTDLPNYLALAAERAPELVANPAYDGVLNALHTANETGTLTPDLAMNLQTLAANAPDAQFWPGDMPPGVAGAFGGDALTGFLGSYLDFATGAARFEIVLKDEPYSLAAMNTVDNLKHVLGSVPATSALNGSTAVNADIREYLRIDQRLTIALVLIGILIILLIMLRSVIAPAYLIGTILLSYGTTLGITRIASRLLWGTDKLTWWVPFFMFVFLVALGIDYSIFLFGRIKEEVRQHGEQEGIHRAVRATGSIITSAGIIVAGTFAAMLSGDILGLAQIGFAVSIGILIDTFVVRTVLDPALAAFFGRWTWWPGGVTRRPLPEFDVDQRPAPELSGTD
jgi:RND superfamily putative drug exporter